MNSVNLQTCLFNGTIVFTTFCIFLLYSPGIHDSICGLCQSNYKILHGIESKYFKG